MRTRAGQVKTSFLTGSRTMEPNALQYFGAGLALLIGLNGLFRPMHMGLLVGLAAANKVGHIEIRVLFGSFLVTLPLLAIVMGQVALFEFYGAAAFAAAVIKTTYTFIDDCPLQDIWIGILVDVILAALLLSSWYL